MKRSDLNHLRLLLGWVRCEIGLSPEELIAQTKSILAQLPEPSVDGKQRLVEAVDQSRSVPKYVRAAVKALSKTVHSPGEIVEDAPDEPIRLIT